MCFNGCCKLDNFFTIKHLYFQIKFFHYFSILFVFFISIDCPFNFASLQFFHRLYITTIIYQFTKLMYTSISIMFNYYEFYFHCFDY